MWPPVTWTSVCGLLSLLLSVAQPVASAQCPSDWANYSRRNSCFKIYSTLESLYWATQNCKKKLGGPQNNTEGYLARIFDQQTDEFLKQLLQESGLDAVWIGLEDRGKDGLYKWNDYRELGKGDYVGWKDGEDHQSDGIHSGVTLRKDGWTELYYTNRLAYLCQVPAGLPDVEMTCPPTTEDGHPADITCTFKQAPWTSLTWIVNDQYKKATCYPDFGCKPLSGFQANVDNSSGIVKSKFTILKADFERH
ncbi:snaclec 5, partial [Aplysia californica]|uniref:Snaclec 5 n=1 Tax=Aplysia californica TaxID=6500 RepID=A0ABM1AE38_APLCA